MKIIAVGMNYALHNKELGHTMENKEPVIFMKPDSAILKDGKPFFIPDFSNEIHYETEVVVRICRLGKNIAPRFAHRYYDAVTVGIDFTARDLQRKFRKAGNPWELCKGFDNSAAIGTFVSLEQVGGAVQNFHFNLDQLLSTIETETRAELSPAASRDLRNRIEKNIRIEIAEDGDMRIECSRLK